MSIRMKEWGMMSSPGARVHLPIEGLTGWGEAARRTGEGISAVVGGAAQIMEDRARVSAAGELADFSERLQDIDRETREELASQDVQDWSYAWKTASAPKLAEAVNALSPETRRAGEQLAAVFNARAELEAQRDHELQKIDKARTRWRAQVDRAVQQGDAEQAQQWLQAGQGIFLPTQHLPQESQSIESRAHLSRWQTQLQERPLQALSELAGASQETLPQGKADAQRLAHARTEASRSARQQVLHTLVDCVENEMSPDPAYVQQAVQAGVLTPEQSASVSREPVALTPNERREWMRRVDECPEEQEPAERLMLEIATAAMPAQERRALLRRVEESRSLPAGERLCLSRSLWELYNDGVLGCPGDTAAQQRFAELQQGSLSRLARDGAEEAARWVRELRAGAARWVCFEPKSHTQQA